MVWFVDFILKIQNAPPKMSSTLMLLWQFWQYKHVNSIAWDVYSFIDEDATLLCIPLYPFVDQSCRTAFKFIWFAHTLNYILCGIVKWFFVCMFVLRCIVTFCMSWIGMVWMRCGVVQCSAKSTVCWAECYIIFRAGIVFSWHLVMSLMLSLFLRFHWPSESLLIEIKYVYLLHFPCKIQ